MIALVVVLAALSIYLKSPTVRGAAGERRVNSSLGRKLPPEDYTVLGDLTLPTKSGTTQVDHIVLSKYGIFVIETKNMSGWIFGGENQARWTQVMRRHKSQFQNPLRQNFLHIKVVQGLLSINTNQIENLVVFVGSAKPKTNMPASVFWGTNSLVNYIQSRKTVRFTDDQITGFTGKLTTSSLGSDRETRRAHVQHLRDKSARKEALRFAVQPNPDDPARAEDISFRCPRCSSDMIQRINKKNGQTFHGCSRFPKCRGTRKTQV